jgi:hypothetical protein
VVVAGGAGGGGGGRRRWWWWRIWWWWGQGSRLVGPLPWICFFFLFYEISFAESNTPLSAHV